MLCVTTKAAIHSVNTIHWLVTVRQELNFCISYFARYLELLEAELLYVKAYLCAHFEESRVTTCTRRDTLCQRNGDNATAALYLMHARSGRAVPCGRRSNRRFLVGSSANRFFLYTWSLHNLSTTGFLPWRPRFGARLVHVRFMVYEVANGIGFALPVSVIPPKLQSSIVCRSLFARLSS